MPCLVLERNVREELMKEKIRTFFVQENVRYHFADIVIASDGSIEIIFPTMKDYSGTTHNLRMEDNNVSIISEEHIDLASINKAEKQHYISYHSSGRVNYHKMTFQTAYMEPLSEVREVNTFFIYSFVYPEIAFMESDDSHKDNDVNIDISEFKDQRIDIVFSVCPKGFQLSHVNGFVVTCPLFSLCVEILRDDISLNYSKIYTADACVKLRPHLDKFTEQRLSKDQAYLRFKHALYQTEEAIVLPPNGEGVLEVIFSVEMRTEPWLDIEFTNPDFEAKVITKKRTHIKFKVMDKRHNRCVKNEKEIIITKLILDADIYDEDFIVPSNYK